MFIKKLSSLCSKNRPAVLLCLLGFFFYSSLIVYRYEHFSFYDWDQALLSQSFWNLLHGKLYSSLFGFNTFGDHSTFINLFILPLFALFPFPLTISILEIFLFSASALLLYFMVLEDFDENTSFLITFAYLIFPPNFFSFIHDFNTEAMAPFFILLVILFYRKKQMRNFYFSFLFLFLFKENMPFIVAMVGIWGIFSKDRNRLLWGMVPIVLSFSYFFIVVKWVIPYFRGMEQYSLWGRYDYLGTNPMGILHHVMRLDIFRTMFLNLINIRYLRALFGFLLIPALLSPSVLLLVVPIVTYHLLSSHLPEKTIFFYYGAIITPVIFLASVQTLKKYTMLHPYRRYICWVLIVVNAYQLWTYHDQILEHFYQRVNSPVSQEWKLVRMIPPDAGVMATFEFLPALSLRDNLYSFHQFYSEEFQNPKLIKGSDFYTGRIFKLPDDVSFALIDFNDRLLQILKNNSNVRKRLLGFLQSGAWGSMEELDSVFLFKRGIKDRYPLFHFIDSRIVPPHPVNLIVDDRIELYGYDVKMRSGRMHIIFYWKLLRPEQKDVNLFIDFIDQNGRIIDRQYRSLCYGIWPTQAWKKNQFIEDYQYISISPKCKGRLKGLKVGFYDSNTGIFISTDSKDPLGRIEIKLAN